MQRIAIVVFSPLPYKSAMGRRWMLLAKGLSELGVCTKLFAGYQESNSDVVTENVEIVQGCFGNRTLLNRVKVLYRFCSRLIEFRPTRVIFVYPDIDRLPILIAAKFLGCEICSSYEDIRHSTTSFKSRIVKLRGILSDIIFQNMSDELYPISSSLKKELNVKFPQKKVILLEPVVDPNVYCKKFTVPEQVKSTINYKEDQFWIGYFGTYWSIEGLEILIHVVKELKIKYKNLFLMVAGCVHQGHPSDDVSALINKYDLSCFVKELGWLNTEEMIHYQSLCNCLVMPKLDCEENRMGMPSKLAEYLSMSVPVVASDISDVPKYFKNETDMLIVKAGDYRSLSNALSRLIDDPSLSSRLSNKSRVSALRFSYKTVARKLVGSNV